jgi:hypothetical protein
MKMMVGSTWNAKMAPGSRRDQRAESSGIGKAELPEQNCGSSEGGGEHFVHHATRPRHGALPVVEAKHQEGEGNLQAQSPYDNRAPADVFAVCRAQPGCNEHGQNTKQSCESIQCGTSSVGY